MHQSDSVSVLMYSFDGNCLEITRYLSIPGYIRGVLSQSKLRFAIARVERYVSLHANSNIGCYIRNSATVAQINWSSHEWKATSYT